MTPEVLIPGLVLGYFGGVIVTGMVFAFGKEAFYWDIDPAAGLAFLWPLIVPMIVIASPFLFASWLGSQWRRHADARRLASQALKETDHG